MAIWGKSAKIDEDIKQANKEIKARVAEILKAPSKFEFPIKKKIYQAAKKIKPSERGRRALVDIYLGTDDGELDSYLLVQIGENCLKFLEAEDIINKFEIYFDDDEPDVRMAHVWFTPERIMMRQRGKDLKYPSVRFSKGICSLEYQSRKFVPIASKGTRAYGLIEALHPFGPAKTIEHVFENMRIERDKYNRDLEDDYRGLALKRSIIKVTIKDIYRKLKRELALKKVKGHTLRFRFVEHGKAIWVNTDKKVKVV